MNWFFSISEIIVSVLSVLSAGISAYAVIINARNEERIKTIQRDVIQLQSNQNNISISIGEKVNEVAKAVAENTKQNSRSSLDDRIRDIERELIDLKNQTTSVFVYNGTTHEKKKAVSIPESVIGGTPQP